MNTRFLLISLMLVSAWPDTGNAESVDISEWLVPWENSQPGDPFVDQRGRVWFVGQRSDYVANLQPESGNFSRYDLDRDTRPLSLLINADGDLWFSANRQRYIGQLNPANGQITRHEMPNSRARDPHTLLFNSAGDIWFTVQQGNFIGKLTVANGDITLLEIPTRKTKPTGIVLDSLDEPWAAGFGRNLLLRVDSANMEVLEIELPNKKARPVRLVATSDNRIWWADFARGYLGRFDPDSGAFSEWPMPGGEDSEPHGMAVDRLDRIWIVESGLNPNVLVGFDTATEQFFSSTAIPSGGKTVRQMHYFEPAGEIWFGTDTNYIGRAVVH